MPTKIVNKPEASEAETIEQELQEALETPSGMEQGFHVVVDGKSLGCYPTLVDATAYGEGQIKHNGLDYEILEVK